ncbi:cytochrome P450 6A1 [Delitschia confertaspora ATCC 74209]|uniref:Cytochrome P450 6A1 n=1 Tax=Delitschia confertaspora ATCC 74209 TaxID=1513339 RepID=A0A9P4MS67_9PLEO|nr:cytochrome P450 6A1 [Delitschia confertaspora ATCC 74209]
MAVLSLDINQFTASPITFLILSTATLFTLFVAYHTYSRRILPNAPEKVSSDLPLSGALGFWTERWDFYKNAIKKSPTGNFTFHAGSHTIVGLSGEKGRKLFFESRELGFGEGYAVLFGQSPPKVNPEAIQSETEKEGNKEFSSHIHRRLHALLSGAEFKRKLPTLLSDVSEAIEDLKNDASSLTDPFESIYRIVFKLTIRMVGAREMAEDPSIREKTLSLFETIEQSATPLTVMFPKLPTIAKLKRTYAGTQLYMILKRIIEKRKASGEKEEDSLQFMLDQGDKIKDVIHFIMSSLFAGQLNSGINAAWVLCWLAKSERWRNRVRDEIHSVAMKYNASNPSLPLTTQLANIPLEAWESEFPSLDFCLRESIRLTLVGTAFRKNITGRSIPTGNGEEVIPPDAFVTYATSDAHLDPSIYRDPEEWDPSRYFEGRQEDKKSAHGYIGWGTGRHPCSGMRFAKLENNLITAYFLATFDFDLTDKNGVSLPKTPKVDFNGHAAEKPHNKVYLKYQVREKS